MAHVLPLIADAESTEKNHLVHIEHYLTVEWKRNNHSRVIRAKCYGPLLCIIRDIAIRGDLFMFEISKE